MPSLGGTLILAPQAIISLCAANWEACACVLWFVLTVFVLKNLYSKGASSIIVGNIEVWKGYVRI